MRIRNLGEHITRFALACGISALSGVVGGVFAGVSVLTWSTPVAQPGDLWFIAVLGLFFGVVASPAIAVIVYRRPLGTFAVHAVFVPAIVAFLVMFSREPRAVIICWLVALFVVSVLCRRFLPKWEPAPVSGECAKCGYDVRGLVKCPECGAAVGDR